jgi:hypothetical protein
VQERSVNKVLLAFLTARPLGYKAVGRLSGLGECRCSAPDLANPAIMAHRRRLICCFAEESHDTSCGNARCEALLACRMQVLARRRWLESEQPAIAVQAGPFEQAKSDMEIALGKYIESLLREGRANAEHAA